MLKTIHYRQIDWIGNNENILPLLNQALASFPLVENTSHRIGIENAEVRHRNSSPQEVRLHVVTYVEGATKGIRPISLGAVTAAIGEATPPLDTDFVEKEIAMVIRPDRLGYVASGHVFGSHVEKSLRALLALHHPTDVANRLLLPARADLAMIAQLIEGGVDRLDLSVALPGPDAQVVGIGAPQGIAASLGAALWGGLSARIFEDHGPDDIDALANATANIGIRLGRKPSVDQIEALTEVANDAISSGDEFTIRNMDGVVFSREKLSLKSSYRQLGGGSILAVNQAWQEISTFLNTVD